MSTERETHGRIPWGVLDSALFALEVARPDTKENGPVRQKVDEAIHYLEKFGAVLPAVLRESETDG